MMKKIFVVNSYQKERKIFGRIEFGRAWTWDFEEKKKRGEKSPHFLIK